MTRVNRVNLSLWSVWSVVIGWFVPDHFCFCCQNWFWTRPLDGLASVFIIEEKVPWFFFAAKHNFEMFVTLGLFICQIPCKELLDWLRNHHILLLYTSTIWLPKPQWAYIAWAWSRPTFNVGWVVFHNSRHQIEVSQKQCKPHCVSSESLTIIN